MPIAGSRRFTGTTGVFRPDGACARDRSRDGSIALVDAETGATRDTLRARDAVGSGVAFDGKHCARYLAQGVYLVDPDDARVVVVARGDVQAAAVRRRPRRDRRPDRRSPVERDGTVARAMRLGCS